MAMPRGVLAFLLVTLLLGTTWPLIFLYGGHACSYWMCRSQIEEAYSGCLLPAAEWIDSYRTASGQLPSEGELNEAFPHVRLIARSSSDFDLSANAKDWTVYITAGDRNRHEYFND